MNNQKQIISIEKYTRSLKNSSSNFSRKEVFQPHLPVRLPCYDLAPITGFTLGGALTATYFKYSQLSWLDGRCVQGPGTYSPRHC